MKTADNSGPLCLEFFHQPSGRQCSWRPDGRCVKTNFPTRPVPAMFHPPVSDSRPADPTMPRTTPLASSERRAHSHTVTPLLLENRDPVTFALNHHPIKGLR
jgi:hypothetical protein